MRCRDLYPARGGVPVEQSSLESKTTTRSLVTSPAKPSKPFQNPGIGTSAGFPEGDVAPVGAGNGPTDIFIGILQELGHTTTKIDVEQSLRVGESRRTRPQTLIVGSPVQTGNSPIALQRERAGLSSFRGKEMNFRAAPLGQGNGLAIGRKAPV